MLHLLAQRIASLISVALILITLLIAWLFIH